MLTLAQQTPPQAIPHIGGLFALVWFLVVIGVWIFFIWLFVRAVRAFESMASALHRMADGRGETPTQRY